ncbi:MAG: major facilitator superfamily domain-containing protein 1 [Gammaproteobacteria bacterium]|nr:major facilitator superfamily domain-containing protein 1 [Gammaproteobacteria bacterium]
MTKRITQRMGWCALALTSLALFGNFYVYDSIAPVAEMLATQLGYSDTQIGTLNAIYSLPNVVMVLVGGMLVDRYGVGRMGTITAAICLVGAILTAASPDFYVMAAGRLFFGIGAETFNIATLSAATLWFPLHNTALAMAVGIAFGRAGSLAADLSPTWAASVYAQGWQAPLVLAAVLAATSFVLMAAYWWFERRTGVAELRSSSHPEHRPSWRDVLAFGRPYWYLLVLCVLWYAVILAFRSTFAIKYFQQAHAMPLAEAGQVVSLVFGSALITTPIFGWISDRTGRYSIFLAFGALLLPVALAAMAFADGGLRAGTVLTGISFSVVPAVMWPMVSRLVEPKRFGTANGMMWVIQNGGIAAANFVAGWLNDKYGASAANPAGYEPMMLFFITVSSLGFLFALLLWRSARAGEGRAPAPLPG